MKQKFKFLIALTSTPNDKKDFCHQTILIKAETQLEAESMAKEKYPRRYIGKVKKVDY